VEKNELLYTVVEMEIRMEGPWEIKARASIWSCYSTAEHISERT
jgi:hypothetical protein